MTPGCGNEQQCQLDDEGALRAFSRDLAVAKKFFTDDSCFRSGTRHFSGAAGICSLRAAGGYSHADTDVIKGSDDLDRIASQSTWYPCMEAKNLDRMSRSDTFQTDDKACYCCEVLLILPALHCCQ